MRRIYIISIVSFVTGATLLVKCSQLNNEGEKLAKTYCSTCHIFPDPSLLDKPTWSKNVLPAMGRLLGVPQFDQHPFEESDRLISGGVQLISTPDWQKIVEYYSAAAPKNLLTQNRPRVDKITARFQEEKKVLSGYPANTFVKFDPGNKRIYAAGMDSLMTILNEKLNSISNISLGGIMVNMFFNKGLDTPGPRNGVLTDIGIMDPNDLKTGSASTFTIDVSGKIIRKKIIDTIPRPVESIAADLDGDGRTDYLVCGFGNKQGSFFWMKNNGKDGFEQKMLRPLPGAIKASINDINSDGLPDIIVLFAQADEGIFLFLNKGQGQFETKALLRFSPLNGSTFFEMIDFNGDGKKDILYTCGDNADHSKVLKNYHGVYIYLDQGDLNFKQHFFFPLHGAFKALARDFDNDGDLDIASISYFPDTKDQPAEGFVYLEQTAVFQFQPYTAVNVSEGRWITMDAGDIDADGDQDIVLGSLFLPHEIENSKEDLKKKPALLLLRNKTVLK